MTTARSLPGQAAPPPFGTAFGEQMAVAEWAGGEWSSPRLIELSHLSLHPASHVLHYGSACFEGLKAHRGDDGTVRVFRLDRHVARLRASADRLWLPVPPASLVEAMVVDTVRANLSAVPEPPGSLYIRPTLIGTEANIGAAGSPTGEALLYILTSPVGDYFAGGVRPLRIAVETKRPRTTPQFGSVKAGANYAMALGITMEARSASGVAQVLFVPDGVIQETGASNVLLLDGQRLITPALDGSFLEGVTRDSVLALAEELGMDVQERRTTLEDVLEWCESGEIALSGTAAVLAPVGTLVVDGEDIMVGDGAAGPATLRLRQMLVDAQSGRLPDTRGWTTVVT